MIDPLEAVRAWLIQEGTALYDVVGTRVYIDPPGQPFPNKKTQSLSFSVVDGHPLIPAMPMDRMWFDFKGWAWNPSKASDVLRALDETLTGLSNETIVVDSTTISIRMGVRDSSIQPLPDGPESKGWSSALVTFEMIIQTDAVS